MQHTAKQKEVFARSFITTTKKSRKKRLHWERHAPEYQGRKPLHVIVVLDKED